MSGRPTAAVSVCIPVKDRVASLRLAVASVAAQTILPCEIVIVDDGSTVPITEASLPLIPKGVSITIVRNEVNMGGGASRNRAVEAATQPLVAFLDSDDLFLPDYIERVTDVWSDAALGSFSAIATGFYWCGPTMEPYKSHNAAPSTDRAHLLLRGNTIGGCSVLSVHRDMFLEVGGFSEKRGADDWELFLSLTARAPISAIPLPLVLYQAPALTSGESMTGRNARQIIALIGMLRGLSKEDARTARPLIRLLVAKHLAFARRRKSAARQLVRSLTAGGRPSGLHLQIATAIFLGPAFITRLLRRSAAIRASRLAREDKYTHKVISEYLQDLKQRVDAYTPASAAAS